MKNGGMRLMDNHEVQEVIEDLDEIKHELQLISKKRLKNAISLIHSLLVENAELKEKLGMIDRDTKGHELKFHDTIRDIIGGKVGPIDWVEIEKGLKNAGFVWCPKHMDCK